MSSQAFQRHLDRGVIGESLVARLLRRRGWYVLPAYEVGRGSHAGPRLYLPEGELIVPDMFVFNSHIARWVEVKYKAAFTYHRITARFVTGIDLPNYRDYIRVNDETPWPVSLMFLHDGGEAKDSPEDHSSGLFGCDLNYLRHCINHTHENGGSHGMVYWAKEHLKQIATLEEVLEANRPASQK